MSAAGERARHATEFFGLLVPGRPGCVFDHAAPDLVLGHIDVSEALIAGTGFLFAPAIVALADTCAAIGCGNNIAPGESFTTIELKTTFLSSARVGERVTCRCTPAHLGRQTHVWDAVVGCVIAETPSTRSPSVSNVASERFARVRPDRETGTGIVDVLPVVDGVQRG